MDILNNYPIVGGLLTLYAALTVAKLIICLSSLPVAFAATLRGCKGVAPLWLLVSLVLTIFIAIPFMIIPLLISERWSFFKVHSDRTVMRHVMKGLR